MKNSQSSKTLETALSELPKGDGDTVRDAIASDGDLGPYVERLIGDVPHGASMQFLRAFAQRVKGLPEGRGPMSAVLIAYADTVNLFRQARG